MLVVSSLHSTERLEAGIGQAKELIDAVTAVVPPQPNFIGIINVRAAIHDSLSLHYRQPTAEITKLLHESFDGDLARLTELQQGLEHVLADISAYGNNLRIHEVRGGELEHGIAQSITESGLSEKEFAELMNRRAYISRFLLEVLNVYREQELDQHGDHRSSAE